MLPAEGMFAAFGLRNAGRFRGQLCEAEYHDAVRLGRSTQACNCGLMPACGAGIRGGPSHHNGERSKHREQHREQQEHVGEGHDHALLMH